MFYCTTLRILKEISEILGEYEDAVFYETKREESVIALQKKHYDAKTGIMGGGGQFLQSYVLYEHLVPEYDRIKVFEQLISALEEQDYHLLLGIIGMRILFDVLDEFDRRDIVLRIMSLNGYLCPQHMFEENRTTLPESPDGSGSGCHCMWGSTDTVFFRIFGGITVDRSKEIPVIVRPYFVKDLKWVTCTQQLPEGKLSVSWKYVTDDSILCELELPVDALVDICIGDRNIVNDHFNAGIYSFTF